MTNTSNKYSELMKKIRAENAYEEKGFDKIIKAITNSNDEWTDQELVACIVTMMQTKGFVTRIPDIAILMLGFWLTYAKPDRIAVFASLNGAGPNVWSTNFEASEVDEASSIEDEGEILEAIKEKVREIIKGGN